MRHHDQKTSWWQKIRLSDILAAFLGLTLGGMLLVAVLRIGEQIIDHL